MKANQAIKVANKKKNHLFKKLEKNFVKKIKHTHLQKSTGMNEKNAKWNE